MAALAAYSQRHFNRLDGLLRNSYQIDSMLHSMRLLMPMREGEVTASDGSSVRLKTSKEEEAKKVAADVEDKGMDMFQLLSLEVDGSDIEDEVISDVDSEQEKEEVEGAGKDDATGDMGDNVIEGKKSKHAKNVFDEDSDDNDGAMNDDDVSMDDEEDGFMYGDEDEDEDSAMTMEEMIAMAKEMGYKLDSDEGEDGSADDEDESLEAEEEELPPSKRMKTLAAPSSSSSSSNVKAKQQQSQQLTKSKVKGNSQPSTTNKKDLDEETKVKQVLAELDAQSKKKGKVSKEQGSKVMGIDDDELAGDGNEDYEISDDGDWGKGNWSDNEDQSKTNKGKRKSSTGASKSSNERPSKVGTKQASLKKK